MGDITDTDKPQQTTKYKIGDLILFNKNKQGLIRYIGPLHNDYNEWYGIEVIGGNKGFDNGSLQKHQYFECASNQGIFIKKYQIIRPLTSSDFAMNKKEKRKKYKHKRNISLTDIEDKLSSNPKIKKLGPRDIGRVKKSEWRPIDGADDIIDDEMKKSFLDPSIFKSKTQRRKRAKSSALFVRKSGPSKRKNVKKAKTPTPTMKKSKKKKSNKQKQKKIKNQSLNANHGRMRSRTIHGTLNGMKLSKFERSKSAETAEKDVGFPDIEQIKGHGLNQSVTLKKQLDELYADDFDKEFEENMRASKFNENEFKEQNDEIIKELESASDFEDESIFSEETSNKLKITRILWHSQSQSDDGMYQNNEQYLE